jgi:hypothetical protein
MGGRTGNACSYADCKNSDFLISVHGLPLHRAKKMWEVQGGCNSDPNTVHKAELPSCK